MTARAVSYAIIRTFIAGTVKPARRLGTMSGSGRIIGDIVGPMRDESVKE